MITKQQLERLAESAWSARERAHVLGHTRVGCAAVAENGEIYLGCNVEHQFRSHDIHAEVNAISSLVAGGHRVVQAVVVVAERDQFTPCGACMDWIFEFGGPGCSVAFQGKRGGDIRVFRAGELMPYYPH